MVAFLPRFTVEGLPVTAIVDFAGAFFAVGRVLEAAFADDFFVTRRDLGAVLAEDFFATYRVE